MRYQYWAYLVFQKKCRCMHELRKLVSLFLLLYPSSFSSIWFLFVFTSIYFYSVITSLPLLNCVLHSPTVVGLHCLTRFLCEFAILLLCFLIHNVSLVCVFRSSVAQDPLCKPWSGFLYEKPDKKGFGCSFFSISLDFHVLLSSRFQVP